MNALTLVAALAMAAPKVGDVAPDFSAKDTDGSTVTLSTMLKEGPVILAFFPKAFTPG
jgi:peroxiredoxin